MKKILFDTDLGGDCDDVMALDLLIAGHKAGECQLMGVTYSWRCSASPACIHAILHQHGMNVPVGARPATAGLKAHYGDDVAAAFPEEAEGDVEDAVTLLRRVLAKEDKVTLVVTGSLFNVAELLKSAPDDVSPLDGVALVREKVEEMAVMAGNFSHMNGLEPMDEALGEDGSLSPMPECNITLDRQSSVEFFALCPVPVVLSPFELGFRMYSGGPMCAAGDGKVPDSLAYIVHGSPKGRDSWDPSTAYYALYGAKPWMYKSVRGTVTVDEGGCTHFAEGKGEHVILYPATAKEKFAAEMDRLVMRLF